MTSCLLAIVQPKARRKLPMMVPPSASTPHPHGRHSLMALAFQYRQRRTVQDLKTVTPCPQRDFSWRPPYLLCHPFMKSKNTSHTTMATPSFARMKRQHIALQPAIFRMSQILTCVVHSEMQSRRVEQRLASYLHSQHPAGTHLLARVRHQWFIPPDSTPFMPHGCDIFAPC